MGEAIGQVLSYAVGVALSPIPIIGVTLMLGTPGARPNGLTQRVDGSEQRRDHGGHLSAHRGEADWRRYRRLWQLKNAWAASLSLVPEQHLCLALEINIGLAADVDRDAIDRPAGESERR
jgi:hypothetical protein